MPIPGQPPDPSPQIRGIRGVLFDVDGTLYDQPRMRRLMAWEMLGQLVRHPFVMGRRARGLRAYRGAQESLRRSPQSTGSLEQQQLELSARRASMPVEELALVVREWMDSRPLKHLARCRAEGLIQLFDFLRSAQIRIGVFSDYPALAKLQTLGVAEFCEVVASAGDPDIAAFKPDPRGFLVACQRLGLAPGEVLMVGDRRDVDAEGAAAAGMPCVIIGTQGSSTLKGQGCLFLDSLERVRSVIADRR